MGIKEELRRLFRSDQENSGNFLEDLRVKKEREEALRRQENERLTLQHEAEIKAFEERLREFARMTALRRKALQGSIVPAMVTELSHLIDKPLYASEEGDEISIDLGMTGKTREQRGNNHYWQEYIYLRASGMEDGFSVRIGETILDRVSSSNPTLVDQALRKAYQHPQKKWIDMTAAWEANDVGY